MEKIQEDETFVTYHGKVKLGSLGDFGTEWWTEEDWNKHRARIAELAASGDLGKEVEVTLRLTKNPLFDNQRSSPKQGGPLETYRLIFIDNETPQDNGSSSD